ncbi:hypothetical protein FOZ61_005159 [Perkinsus olseni]|uniref:Uncharacterized protein n=1 Tax=Perkinsus olseni TaxID=32597 RepID=A0A7J6MVX5_PEROL|nr:hypothetical protein FOZ61_005159 [Perkinsus olseni]KAF4675477.1 hypothetical protein FOL46_001416 [Perkinsus olseni]
MSSSSTCASSIELIPAAPIFIRSFGQRKMDCWVICDKNKAAFKLKARGDDHNLQMVACEGEYRSISLYPGSRKKEKKTNPLLRVLSGDAGSSHWRLSYRCPTCPKHNIFYTDFVTAFNYGGTDTEFSMDLRPVDHWCRCRTSDDSSVPRSNGKNRQLTVHLGDGENPSYFFKVDDEAGKVCLKVVRSQAAGANTEGDILGLTYKEPFNTAAAFGITTAVMTAWKESHPSGNLLRRLMKKCTTSVPKSPEELLKVAKGAVVCGVMKKKISEKK